MAKDITEEEIIIAVRMIGDGKTWEQVVERLYPDTEYPELMVVLTCERVRHWYKQQTPQRLMEVLS